MGQREMTMTKTQQSFAFDAGAIAPPLARRFADWLHEPLPDEPRVRLRYRTVWISDVHLGTPGCGRSKEARELGSLIPDRFELTVERLVNFKLPRSVQVNGKTVARMPALYQH